jgi:hypothetical protein
MQIKACLRSLGHSADAFDTGRDAAKLNWQVLKEHGSAMLWQLNEILAHSLNGLSNRLSCMQRHRERALRAIQEALEICGQQAKDHPNRVYDPNLADFLNNLSLRLSDLGHEHSALKAIEEAVED